MGSGEARFIHLTVASEGSPPHLHEFQQAVYLDGALLYEGITFGSAPPGFPLDRPSGIVVETHNTRLDATTGSDAEYRMVGRIATSGFPSKLADVPVCLLIG